MIYLNCITIINFCQLILDDCIYRSDWALPQKSVTLRLFELFKITVVDVEQLIEYSAPVEHLRPAKLNTCVA